MLRVLLRLLESKPFSLPRKAGEVPGINQTWGGWGRS